ncbi:MAG TPA: DUF4380 domain-containing protein [Candidatus Methylacidiphilales bacterium]
MGTHPSAAVPLLFRLFFLLLLLPSAAPRCGAGERAGEAPLLLLRNGGRVAGIEAGAGGRVVLFRLEEGANVLDGRPALWGDRTPADAPPGAWKQYYGESVWTSPQAAWWTDREPFPPRTKPANVWPGQWPPDPAWEMAPYEVVERSASRVVLRSRPSALNGLELVRTVELLPDGKLRLAAEARNTGAQPVARGLWMIARVPPAARLFLPQAGLVPDKGLPAAARVAREAGLTVVTPTPEAGKGKSLWASPGGKISGPAAAHEGWMAAATHEAFFVIRFAPPDAALVAPGHAPVEVFVRAEPEPIVEVEAQGALREIPPGGAARFEETWEIVPNPGLDTVAEQARFLKGRFP